MASDYDILGLPSTAKREDIKKAYRRLSLRYHPDRPDGNAEKYLVIRDAYEHLVKPDTTRIHDQYEHRTTPYANVESSTIDKDGDCLIMISFANLIFIAGMSPLPHYVHWAVYGMNTGTLIIKKKDLEKCGYKFTLKFVPIIGHSIFSTFEFKDPRTKWEKFVDKLKFIW